MQIDVLGIVWLVNRRDKITAFHLENCADCRIAASCLLDYINSSCSLQYFVLDFALTTRTSSWNQLLNTPVFTKSQHILLIKTIFKQITCFILIFVERWLAGVNDPSRKINDPIAHLFKFGAEQNNALGSDPGSTRGPSTSQFNGSLSSYVY